MTVSGVAAPLYALHPLRRQALPERAGSERAASAAQVSPTKQPAPRSPGTS